MPFEVVSHDSGPRDMAVTGTLNAVEYLHITSVAAGILKRIRYGYEVKVKLILNFNEGCSNGSEDTSSCLCGIG